jgi:hypothetical protein
MKTSDPLLQEIKSRIYQSYGRRQEAEKSLAEFEKANSKSLSLLERRITQAIESHDKEKLMDYLDQLTQLLREKPKSWINPSIQAEWNKRFAEWKSEIQSK